LLVQKRKTIIMRKKGNVFAFSEQRDKDLLDAYHRQLEKQLSMYGRIIITGLIQKVINSNASRYWVSSERACVVINKLEKGESINYMKANKIRFYKALYKEFCTFRETHPEMPKKHIVEIVITHPAPCFGMSQRVAGNIIRRMKKKCREEKVKRFTSK